MWYEFLLEGLKKFAGEIIGIVLITVVLSMFPGLRNLFTRYKKLKKEDADDADVRQALERIQRQFEDTLQQSETKQQSPAMSDEKFLKLCKSGNASRVEKAIINGANANAKNNYSLTALMSAAGNGKTETAEVLLKHGADINAADNYGNTALMYAERFGHRETANLLQRYGAK